MDLIAQRLIFGKASTPVTADNVLMQRRKVQKTAFYASAIAEKSASKVF